MNQADRVLPENFTIDNLVIKDNLPQFWEWSKTLNFCRIANCMLIEWWVLTTQAIDRPDFPGLDAHCCDSKPPQTWEKWRVWLGQEIATRYVNRMPTLEDERALEVIWGDRYLIACLDICRERQKMLQSKLDRSFGNESN